MLEVREIKNKESWEGFILSVKEKTFLQSWNWGKFNQSLGTKVWKLGVYWVPENGKKTEELLVGTALVLKVKAKRGDFLFVPHGPNVRKKEMKPLVFKKIMEELKKLAHKEEVVFIRIAPVWQRNRENDDIFKNLGFRSAPLHVHPELTWELDISPSCSDILMGMRKNTRYLIRKGGKNPDVKIEKSQDEQSIRIFNNLYQFTKERHSFVPFSLKYLKKEFLSFSQDGQILLLLGNYRGETVSSGIFVFWQGIGFYHHGASSRKYPKVPVSYLLLWKAIEEAKERGCHTFNFWGVTPPKAKSHPWAGLTLFKKGFGGKRKFYVKTKDFVISPRYWGTFLVEKIRKIKRGL